MKKFIFAFAIFLTVYGVAMAAPLSYTPLEPLPGTTQGGQTLTSLPALLSALFKLLITFGALFAVVMLVVAGIGYMVSEAAVDIEKAKERARAALWGLLLLTTCWLILNTINPNLLKFQLNIPGITTTPASGTTSGKSSYTDAELQELRKTYSGGVVEVDTTSGQAANDQEAQFRRQCESRGGSVKTVGSDGYNTTYGCDIPLYMP